MCRYIIFIQIIHVSISPSHLYMFNRSRGWWSWPQLTIPHAEDVQSLQIHELDKKMAVHNSDHGHTCVFDSIGCEIMKMGINKVVAIATRTPQNIYMLEKINQVNCYMGKEDES